MNQLADDLRAARALIDTPEKWTKGGYGNRQATCVMGAFDRADIGLREAWDQLRLALPEGPWGRSLVDFNDDPTTTHADIMSLFSRAIATAESQS